MFPAFQSESSSNNSTESSIRFNHSIGPALDGFRPRTWENATTTPVRALPSRSTASISNLNAAHTFTGKNVNDAVDAFLNDFVFLSIKDNF